MPVSTMTCTSARRFSDSADAGQVLGRGRRADGQHPPLADRLLDLHPLAADEGVLQRAEDDHRHAHVGPKRQPGGLVEARDRQRVRGGGRARLTRAFERAVAERVGDEVGPVAVGVRLDDRAQTRTGPQPPAEDRRVVQQRPAGNQDARLAKGVFGRIHAIARSGRGSVRRSPGCPARAGRRRIRSARAREYTADPIRGKAGAFPVDMSAGGGRVRAQPDRGACQALPRAGMPSTTTHPPAWRSAPRVRPFRGPGDEGVDDVHAVRYSEGPLRGVRPGPRGRPDGFQSRPRAREVLRCAQDDACGNAART